MSGPIPNALYNHPVIVDTAPLSPFAASQTAFGPATHVKPYTGAGVTFAVFTVVDDFPNSIEQTIEFAEDAQKQS